MLKTIDTTPSTNALMASDIEAFSHGDILMAREQTAGRGQRGNSWESAPGENVTMSLMLKELPVKPSRQFSISEAAALAVADVVARRLPPEYSDKVAVKWPNDIYVGNSKIAGILIECALSGDSIAHAIVGIGLNVRQTEFVSDAPNPTSLALLGGKTRESLSAIAVEIGEETASNLARPFRADALHERYLSRLWRREGLWPWKVKSTGRLIFASIVKVTDSGILILRPEGDVENSSFHFKEVEAISNLPKNNIPD